MISRLEFSFVLMISTISKGFPPDFINFDIISGDFAAFFIKSLRSKTKSFKIKNN